jgi:hypothetical protein
MILLFDADGDCQAHQWRAASVIRRASIRID